MAFTASADSSRAQLRYVAEVTPGTTPTTPQMTDLRFTGESLNASRTTQASQEIRSDRQVPDVVTTAESYAGDINFELSYGEFDPFLEAVLQGTWTTDVLTNGVTRRSFTIEKEFSDVTKFVRFRGVELQTMSLNMSAGGFVTGTFGTMGRGATNATTPLDADPTPSQANQVYNLTQHMTGLSINGSAYADGIQALSFELNNNAREQRQIGSKDLAGIGMGTLSLTGSMTAYFGNATAIQAAYDADTAVSISWTLIADGKSYLFELPHVKFTSLTTVAQGINQDVVLELAWQAVRDPEDNITIRITRAED